MVIEYPLSMLEGKARVLENGTINDFDNASGKLYRRISLSSFFFFFILLNLFAFSFLFFQKISTHMIDCNVIPIVDTSLFIF